RPLAFRLGDVLERRALLPYTTLFRSLDPGPVVAPKSTAVAAAHNQSFAVSSLFTASDPFGDPITTYDFWNRGTGGGHFVSATGQTLAVNQDNYVSAAQLAQTTYQSGSGPDTLWARVSDPSTWQARTTAFTVNEPVDT